MDGSDLEEAGKERAKTRCMSTDDIGQRIKPPG